MTDAEEALRQAEFGYAEAVFDYLSARAQLDMALGTAPEAPGEIPVIGG
jgi:outer membrane protein TolC